MIFTLQDANKGPTNAKRKQKMTFYRPDRILHSHPALLLVTPFFVVILHAMDGFPR